jgi:hypothetical protein
MNKRLIIAIFSLTLILCTVGSDAQCGGSEVNNIKNLYYNILIGELLPSGNVYLERFSLDGGYDNQQHFEGFNHSNQIDIHPIKQAEWRRVKAKFSRLIKATYIGGIEKNSEYFEYPFSKASQDALLYKLGKQTTDTPLTVVSINNYQIEELIYFDGSDIRKFSNMEYNAVIKHIKRDHERKDNYGTTLSKINEANTLLNARKLALFRIKNVVYEVLLSVYRTHGTEYASTVYVIDFKKNGQVVFTKEKYNTDGPY